MKFKFIVHKYSLMGTPLYPSINIHIAVAKLTSYTVGRLACQAELFAAWPFLGKLH